MSQTEPAIVIGVPGKWKDRSDIVRSIAEKSGGYLFAGGILMDTNSDAKFEIEIYDHDPSLAEKVRSGSMGKIPEKDLKDLEDHTFTIYVLSDETGRDVVSRLSDAVTGLLEAGGIVSKVEFAGFTVGSDTWKDHAKTKVAYSLYRSMVTLVGSGTEFFTCGMRAFALPDCSVHGAELDEAFEVATEFCCYMMDESPKFGDGHTFSVPDGTQKFKMLFDRYSYYETGDSFHNPEGLWRLMKEGTNQSVDTTPVSAPR